MIFYLTSFNLLFISSFTSFGLFVPSTRITRPLFLYSSNTSFVVSSKILNLCLIASVSLSSSLTIKSFAPHLLQTPSTVVGFVFLCYNSPHFAQAKRPLNLSTKSSIGTSIYTTLLILLLFLPKNSSKNLSCSILLGKPSKITPLYSQSSL